jgi:prepilin-type N-terminal cleavage/methylation domain-containing protein
VRDYRIRSKKGFGFTLIELLIVIAIILILISIALPNFLSAQTRARVTKVMGDERSVGLALESYRSDFKKFPVPKWAAGWDFLNGPLILLMGGLGVPPSQAGNTPYIGTLLTTPTKYIGSIPIDPFNTNMIPGPINPTVVYNGKRVPMGQLMSYWLPTKAGEMSKKSWVDAINISYQILTPTFSVLLESAGPDLEWWAHMGNANGGTGYQTFIYSPTNGISSEGQIVWIDGKGVPR